MNLTGILMTGSGICKHRQKKTNRTTFIFSTTKMTGNSNSSSKDEGNFETDRQNSM